MTEALTNDLGAARNEIISLRRELENRQYLRDNQVVTTFKERKKKQVSFPSLPPHPTLRCPLSTTRWRRTTATSPPAGTTPRRSERGGHTGTCTKRQGVHDGEGKGGGKMAHPTSNGGMQNGSSVGIYIFTLHVHIFAHLAPIFMPSRCSQTKFLMRSSVGSLLRVRCWLGSRSFVSFISWLLLLEREGRGMMLATSS